MNREPGMRGGGCPMCGMMGAGMMGREEMAEEPGTIRDQIRNLERRLDELERGETSPEELREQEPQMCPMCQGMMGGMGERAGREEMEETIQEQIGRLEGRIEELEGRRR